MLGPQSVGLMTRIGVADREERVAVLTAAAASGYLSLDELVERLAAVWGSVTQADLVAVTEDLPAPPTGACAYGRCAGRRALAHG